MTWEPDGRDWLLDFDAERTRRARVMPFGTRRGSDDGGWDVKVFGGEWEAPVVDYKLFTEPGSFEAAKAWAEGRVALGRVFLDLGTVRGHGAPYWARGAAYTLEGDRLCLHPAERTANLPSEPREGAKLFERGRPVATFGRIWCTGVAIGRLDFRFEQVERAVSDPKLSNV